MAIFLVMHCATHLVNDPINFSSPFTSSRSANTRSLRFGLPLIVMADCTCEREFIVRLVSEARPISVKVPVSLSKSGAASFLRPGAPSAVKEPWISEM